MNSISKILSFVLPLGLVAGCSEPESEPLNIEDVPAMASKADGLDISLSSYGPGYRIALQGAPAGELWNILEDAGGFYPATSGNLSYLLGSRLGCVSNGSQAACAIVSRFASDASDDFVATIHGRRFRSSSSELFGAIARAQGVSPASVTSVATSTFHCAKSQHNVWCGVGPSSEAMLSFDNLPVLGEHLVYEGWAITDAGPISTGRFSDPAQAVLTVSSAVENASLFVLTLEPATDDDPAPAATHILAGPIVDGVAILSIDHAAALGTDFSSATGEYILAAPSGASLGTPYQQGLWFLDPNAGPGASLDLPTLPDGWAYEGWVVGADGPISTGRFTELAAADSDGAGQAAGPDGSPGFPGQDFVNPATNLLGHAVVISVEPEPDDSLAPFVLKPLIDSMVEDPGAAGVSQALMNKAAENTPTGMAVFN